VIGTDNAKAGPTPATDPAPPTRGGRPRSQALDRALLDATLATLQEEGYARLSMLGVAKRAGVPATTLYRRWSSKAELVVAAIATLTPVIDRPDTGSLAEDLRIAMRQRAQTLSSDEGLLFLGLLVETLKSPDLFTAVRDRLSGNLKVVAEVVDQAVQRGEIPPIDLNLALDVIAGPFWSRLLSGVPPTPDQVDDLVPMIVAALKAAPHTAP
jgi:AcrR family transcriptional regulator